MIHAQVAYLGIFSREKAGGPKPAKQYYYSWEVRDEYGVYHYAQACDRALKPVSGIFLVEEGAIGSLKFEPRVYAVPATRSADVLSVFDGDRTRLPKIEILKKEPEKDRNDDPAVIRENAVVMREDFDRSIAELLNPERCRKALRAIKGLPYRPEIRPPHKYMLKDCQTALRTRSMTDVAVIYAERIVELDPSDDHAEANLARLLVDMQRLSDALKHVERAMTLEHSEADGRIYGIFLEYLRKRQQKERLLYGRRR